MKDHRGIHSKEAAIVRSPSNLTTLNAKVFHFPTQLRKKENLLLGPCVRQWWNNFESPRVLLFKKIKILKPFHRRPRLSLFSILRQPIRI